MGIDTKQYIDLEAVIDTSASSGDPGESAQKLRSVDSKLPSRVNIGPDSIEKDLAKLVLGSIEFIRRLLEKQAIRRVEGGGLSPGQIENLGLVLL